MKHYDSIPRFQDDGTLKGEFVWGFNKLDGQNFVATYNCKKKTCGPFGSRTVTVNENMEKITWVNVWQPPFKNDYYGYVWAKDGVMVFTPDDLTEENDKFINTLADDIAGVLNGNLPSQKYSNLEIKDGCDLYMNGEILGAFRGWGHLTGRLKLPAKIAAKLQDEMIEFVLSKIKE